MTFLENIYFAFWFFLPAGLANMFPILAAHLPGLKKLDYPMDFGLCLRGRRILGPHKTMRGLAVGVLVAALVMFLQGRPLMLGVLLGLGALFGDAAKSFFKRQLDILAGESWFLFDQLDYILGGILLTYWHTPLTWAQYGYVVGVYFALHLVFSAIGYLLGLKQKAI